VVPVPIFDVMHHPRQGEPGHGERAWPSSHVTRPACGAASALGAFPRAADGPPLDVCVRACANACQSLSMTAISRRTLPLRLNSCDLVRSLEPPKLFCRMKE